MIVNSKGGMRLCLGKKLSDSYFTDHPNTYPEMENFYFRNRLLMMLGIYVFFFSCSCMQELSSHIQ